MISFFIITVLTALIIFTIYAKIMKAVNKKKKKNETKSYSYTPIPPKEEKPEPESLDDVIQNFPQKFYWKKGSCMTPNESRMFFYINCSLDNLLPAQIRKYYYVFPQVSLYSIIGISDKSLTDDELYYARKHLLKKNADFLICHCRWQKLKTEDPSEKGSGFYAYSPVMWIELDGSSHISGQKYGWDNYINQQHRDAFKDKLAQQLAIPLLRYSLPNDTISPEDRKQIEAGIASALHIEKTS